jgi:hypothetical protein
LNKTVLVPSSGQRIDTSTYTYIHTYIHSFTIPYNSRLRDTKGERKENKYGKQIKIESGWKGKREERKGDTLSFVPDPINHYRSLGIG